MSIHRQDPTPATRAQKAKVISEIATKTVAALVVLGMVAAILVLVVRQDSNTKKVDDTQQTLEQVKEIGQRLVDCTTPGHDCYDRGTQATKAAVTQLNHVIILASSCAATLPNPTPANVQSCVLRHFK